MKHQKTADEAAYKQKACQKQKQGKSQTAWEGVGTGARKDAKTDRKTRVPEAATEGLNRSIALGKYVMHQKNSR